MVAIKDVQPSDKTPWFNDPQGLMKGNGTGSSDANIVDTPKAPEEGSAPTSPAVTQTAAEDPWAKYNPQPAPKEDPWAKYNPQPAPPPSAAPNAINPSPANYQDRVSAGDTLRKNVANVAAQRNNIDPEIAKQAKGAWDSVAGGWKDSHSDDFWDRLFAPLKIGAGILSAASMPFSVPTAKVGQAMEKATGGLLTEGNLDTAMWGMRPVGGLKPLVDGGAGIQSHISQDPDTGAMKGTPVGPFPPKPIDFQNAATAIQGSPQLSVARKMPDGSVKIGKPGQIHADLMTNSELAKSPIPPGVADAMGYTDKNGAFLTRHEALDFASRHEPGRAAFSMEQPEHGLEAATYQNETPWVIEKNLLHAWNEGGQHPAEVMAAAKDNPALMRDLASTKPAPGTVPSAPGPLKLTRAEREEVTSHTNGDGGDPTVLAQIADRANLGSDTTVYRGTNEGENPFNGLSTSASEDAETASEMGKHVVKIIVDKDAPAFRPNDHVDNGNFEEREVILGRGQYTPTGEPDTYRFSRSGPGALGADRTASLPLPPTPSKQYINEFNDHLNRLRGAHTADQSEFLNLLKDKPESLMNPETQGEWYKHAEGDPTADMSPQDGKAYNEHMLPLKREELRLYEELKKTDLPVEDYDPNYQHRMVIGKNPAIDRLAGEGGEEANPIYNGTGLMSRVPSSLKERKYFVAENIAGDRQVVSVKDGELRSVGGDNGGPALHDLKHSQEDPLKVGDQFAANGEPWFLKNAYTREVEAATGTKYYQNAMATTVDNIMHLRAAARAAYTVQMLRSSPEWTAYTMPGRSALGQPIPEGWRSPQMPMFRNDIMDPKMANIIDDFWGDRNASGLQTALEKINNFAVSSMFLTPVPHVHNVAVHAVIARSWDNFTPGGFKSLIMNGAEAMHEVWTQGKGYQDLMREGNGLLYGKVANQDFTSQMFKMTGMELSKDTESMSRFDKILSLPLGGFIKSIYSASARGLWMASDMFMMQRVLELKSLHGMDTRAAIAEAERLIPNYRAHPELVGDRGLAKAFYNPLLFKFTRYHVGVIEGMVNLAKDLAVGSAQQKWNATGSMVAAGVLMMQVYPAVNNMIQRVTGNKDIRLGPAGPLRLIDPLMQKMVAATKGQWSKETLDYYKENKGFLASLENMVSLAPVAQDGLETGLNRYNFTGRNVVEPTDYDNGNYRRVAGQTAEHQAQTMVAPYSILNNVLHKGESPQDAISKFAFGLSEHTNDQETAKLKALRWQNRGANKRANKGGLGAVEKFMGGE